MLTYDQSYGVVMLLWWFVYLTFVDAMALGTPLVLWCGLFSMSGLTAFMLTEV